MAPLPSTPPPGLGELLVTDEDDLPLGTVAWHTVCHGPGAGSVAFNVGISLRPPARGAGHGHRALRLVAQHLFATTTTHRVEASTDVTNTAAQHALERAGYRREGVLRGAQWRAGDWHDLVGYAVLRTDPADG